MCQRRSIPFHIISNIILLLLINLGPSIGLQSIKNNRLCSLPTQLLPKHSQEEVSIKIKSELIQFPSFLSPAINDSIPLPSKQLLKIYQSIGSDVKDDSMLLRSKSLKEKDFFHPTSDIKFSNQVQIHHTTSIVSAFNKIGNIILLSYRIVIINRWLKSPLSDADNRQSTTYSWTTVRMIMN